MRPKRDLYSPPSCVPSPARDKIGLKAIAAQLGGCLAAKAGLGADASSAARPARIAATTSFSSIPSSKIPRRGENRSARLLIGNRSSSKAFEPSESRIRDDDLRSDHG